MVNKVSNLQLAVGSLCDFNLRSSARSAGLKKVNNLQLSVNNQKDVSNYISIVPMCLKKCYQKGLLVLSIMFSQCLAAQDFNISNEKMNDLYIGIENPLKAVAENIRCKDLVLSTDNGQISGKYCDYIIKPDHVGEANLYLFQKTRKDSVLIGTSRFRVRHLPKPVARIADKKEGLIRKEVLQAQSVIIVILENFDISIYYGINGYTFTILRDNVAIYSEDVSDRFLTHTIKEKFSELRSADEVIFSNIKAIGPGGKVDTIDPVILKIE